MSSVAHALLRTEPWTPDTWVVHRMSWFLQMTGFWAEDSTVSVLEL